MSESFPNSQSVQCSILVRWCNVMRTLRMWFQLMWTWASPEHLSKISSKVKKAVPVHTFQNNLAVIFPVKDERGRVYRSETLHNPGSVQACVLCFTRCKWQKVHAERGLDRLKILGVAKKTYQEEDEETVKQRKHCGNGRWVPELPRYNRQSNLHFTLTRLQVQWKYDLPRLSHCRNKSAYRTKQEHLHLQTLIQSVAFSLQQQNRKTFSLKAAQSMKHEESLRYRERTACYSGKHAVIQRPYASGGKCLEGKSVFVNDMGQLFWERLDSSACLFSHPR